MKNLYALLLAALLVLGLCACGGRTASKETTVPPTQTTETPAEQLSMYDLSRAMLGATAFGEMSYVSSADDGAEADFAYLSELDYEKVSQFFLEKVEAGTVFSSGSFAVLLISDDNEAVKAAFTSFLQGK